MVFVKTHKTGGTTITNMILRHGSKSAKIPSLPKIPQPSSGGFKHGYFIDHVFLPNLIKTVLLKIHAFRVVKFSKGQNLIRF